MTNQPLIDAVLLVAEAIDHVAATMALLFALSLVYITLWRACK